MIQIQLHAQLPSPLLLKIPRPFPPQPQSLPPKQESNRIIQIQLHAQLLLLLLELLLLHPQLLAVKSLILISLRKVFILYPMRR